MVARIVSIAGTDPTGGAGIQADIKSITVAGGFAYSVVTSLVAQNTRGVQDVHTPSSDFLKTQLSSVADDVAIDGVKIGMLGSVAVTETVSEFLDTLPADTVIVLDPVMVASSGDRLLDADAEDAVRALARKATVVTPNLPEMATLLGTDQQAQDIDEAIDQARTLAKTLDAVVLMKGGHCSGTRADNALVRPDGSIHRVPVTRVETTNTHGTGCSLSSALATKLAQGCSPEEAAEWASRWVHESIAHADALHVGEHGNGPIDHSHTMRRMVRAGDSTPWSYSPAPSTDPILPPAGPHTAKLWEVSGPLLTEIMELPFIQHLGEGTLPEKDFAFYLHQDGHYLRRYAVALRQLGGAWAASADEAIATEQGMQATWLKAHPTDRPEPSPITRAYTDFLIATVFEAEPAVGMAAVLPCFWLYYEVGARLVEKAHDAHPFKEWLATYGGDEFEQATRDAVQRVEDALTENPELFDQALEAVFLASRHEVEFFDQADRVWVVTDPER